MSASREKVIPKRKLGRPATGRDPLVALRVPKAVIERLDEWSTEAGISRSEAIRHMIEDGLKKVRKPSKGPAGAIIFRARPQFQAPPKSDGSSRPAKKSRRK